MLAIKLIVISALGLILFQDVKERQVYWFLFPIVALCSGTLFYSKTLSELFFIAVIMNMIFVSTLLLIVVLYSKITLKKPFKNTFGSGDVLFFFAIAWSFSTISFIVIFTSALIFSLMLHLILKNKTPTVPLAGYMSLFFGLTYLGHWSGFIQSVYKI